MSHHLLQAIADIKLNCIKLPKDKNHFAKLTVLYDVIKSYNNIIKNTTSTNVYDNKIVILSLRYSIC